jgi:AraC family transcriptional regulator
MSTTSGPLGAVASGTTLTAIADRLASVPLASSDGLGWTGIALARLREPPTEVDLPALPDHVVMVHLAGATTLERGNSAGRRRAKPFGIGEVNFLAAGRPSSWFWNGHPECAQIYLEPGLVERVAAQALDLDAQRLEFVDFHAEADPLVQQLGLALADEVSTGGLAGALFADTVAQTLALHLLRRHSSASPRPRPRRSGLAPPILAGVQDYVEANLSEALRLADLARVAGYAEAHFAQAFKRATGRSPHRYVMERRVERAKVLLTGSNHPLVDVALQTGFQTQSHFTAVFSRLVGAAPKRFRDNSRS